MFNWQVQQKKLTLILVDGGSLPAVSLYSDSGETLLLAEYTDQPCSTDTVKKKNNRAIDQLLFNYSGLEYDQSLLNQMHFNPCMASL